MPIPSHNESIQTILAELSGQPQELKNFASYYGSDAGKALLKQLPLPAFPLFLGEAEGYLAAWLAAQLCRRGGGDACAMEINEALTYPQSVFEGHEPIFWFNSGDAPTENDIYRSAPFMTVTANEVSEFGEDKKRQLPLLPGSVNSLNRVPIINALAFAWLLSRALTGKTDGSETKSLKHLRQRVQLMIDGKEAYFERWQNLLAGTSHWVFVGEGLQLVSARSTAALFANWAKIPALAVSMTEFTHNYHALAAKGMAVVGFAESGPSLLEEILQQAAQCGATSLHVVDGFPLHFDEPARTTTILDLGLNTIPGVISGQLLAVCMAKKFQSMRD